ncbi:MAG: DUF4974 domain-containing protein [Muribaculaceae bacterium]|nr:DUF4974 domain-containing protein [Muribaculaceae bacterium]
MDNLDKLLDAIEHPEKFSTEELLQLLSDPDTHRLYQVLCATRAQSFTSEPEALTEETIDAQWQRLKKRKRKPLLFRRLADRKVAAVISLVIISCSIVAVGVSMSLRQAGKVSSTSDVTTLIPDDVTGNPTETAETLSLPKDTVIIFEDRTLDNILKELAPYYGVTVDLKHSTSKETRLFLKWESTTTLDNLIEHLNSFDRINLTINENIVTDY